MSTHPTLVMTRPEAQARDFVTELESEARRKFKTLYNPLVEIEPVVADIKLVGVSRLLFTSVNGVQEFSKRVEERGIPALCVGKTTADCASNAGFTVSCANGTAPDLLRLALSQEISDSERMLHICGEKVSCDPTKILAMRGIIADRLVLYRQNPLRLGDEAQKLLSTVSTVIPVFSMNGAKIFAQEIENKSLNWLTAVCISENVAAILKSTAINETICAKAPNRREMIKSLLRLL